MERSFPLWVLAAAAAAAGAFFTVQSMLPRSGGIVSGNPVSSHSSSPEAALAGMTAEEDPLLRRMRFLELLNQADPDELQQLFTGGGITRREKRNVAQRWAETDAPGLFKFLKGLGRSDWDRDTEQYDAVRGILFRTWARADADAALAAADSLGNRPQFRTAQWDIIQTLFGSDPARGFAAAVRLPSNPRGDPSVRDRLPDRLWKENPAAFLKAAGEGPKGSLRNYEVRQAVDKAFGELARQDPAAAAEWLKARPPDQQRQLGSGMAHRLAEADPAAARAWFAAIPPSASREKAGAEIVRSLAQKDPRAALEWLQDNLEGGRPQAFVHLAEALAEKGVDSAKQLLEAMPPGGQRDGVVNAIALKWSQKDFKPAMDWVLSLPADDPGRRQAMQQLQYQWAYRDLAGAAAHVRDAGNDGEARQMLPLVSGQYASRNLAEGLAWAETLPPALQLDAYSGFYQNVFDGGKLPEIMASLGKMPVSRQQEIAGRIAANVSSTTYSDPVMNTRFVNSLKSLPEALRGPARTAVEKIPNGSTSQKQAVLEALK